MNGCWSGIASRCESVSARIPPNRANTFILNVWRWINFKASAPVLLSAPYVHQHLRESSPDHLQMKRPHVGAHTACYLVSEAAAHSAALSERALGPINLSLQTFASRRGYLFFIRTFVSLNASSERRECLLLLLLLLCAGRFVFPLLPHKNKSYTHISKDSVVFLCRRA